MKVYIKCPPLFTTGGPEFLHQVCAGLRDNGVDAYMFYDTSIPSPQAEIYTARYNNPYTRSIPDEPAAAFIVPEIDVKELFNPKFANFKKCILWASVNFYLTQTKEADLNFFPLDTIHLYPYEYVKSYLDFAKIPEKNRVLVTDYISKEFLALKNTFIPTSNKKNIITYYSAKGNQFTSIITKNLETKYNYKIIPLAHYSTKELIDIYSKSKIHLDFSYFPGKNRTFREALTCKNIILTSNLGAAKYQADVNIKEEYKFLPVSENIKKAEDKIRDCIENFDKYIVDFKESREEVLKEKENFDKNIKVLAEKLKE